MEFIEFDRDHHIIKALIESYREDWQKKQGKYDSQPRDHFYITDVGKCNRAIYYYFKNADKKRLIADRTLIFFRHGDLYHDEIQYRLKKQRIIDNSRDMEYGVKDFEIETTGRLDVFVREDGGLAVTEIKSHNPYAFRTAEPSQKEIDQLLWYIYCAKEANKSSKRKILGYGYLIYVERGEVADFPYRIFKVDYDPKRIKEIRDRFKTLKEAIEKEYLPQRQFERDSIECQYCRFTEFCWKGIPKQEEPEFKADENIEKPEKELVDSAAEQYIKLKEEEKEVKDKLSEVYELLMKYFLSTGVKKIASGGKFIEHGYSKQTELNIEYLKKHAGDKWHLFSNPNLALLRKAIKDGELDPEVFEKAKHIKYQDKLNIKEVKNAD